MWKKKFWMDLTERAFGTFAAALLGTFTFGAALVPSMGWQQALLLSAGTTLYTVLKCIGAAYRGNPDSGSLLNP